MLTFKKINFLYDIITLELMSVYQVKFGKFISTLRKEQNLTQDELAEKLNISSGKTISKWENQAIRRRYSQIEQDASK